MLCSGSRDHMILGWDHREASRPIKRYQGHTQEVCGLRWSPDGQLLASGGNDNKVRPMLFSEYCVDGLFPGNTCIVQ